MVKPEDIERRGRRKFIQVSYHATQGHMGKHRVCQEAEVVGVLWNRDFAVVSTGQTRREVQSKQA